MPSHDHPGYIYIPNWDEFQHYHDRDPVWIKLYLRLLDKDEYRALTMSQRGLLHDIWILVARAGNGRLVASPRTLSGQLGTRVRHLEPLIHAGFIEVRASKLLAQSKSKRRNPLTPSGGGTENHQNGSRTNGTNPRAVEDQEAARLTRVKLIQQCKRLYAGARAEGDTDALARDHLTETFKKTPDIIQAALGAPDPPPAEGAAA